jgi:tetratricopeptide (TPR) repeat protein
LFAAALAPASARAQLAAWLNTPTHTQRRFSVLVNDELLEGAPAEAQEAASEAATRLLALPWELLHDDDDQQGGYLFLGARGARVRRRLPSHQARDAVSTEPPLRVLLLSPRPEDERAAYLDHRVSARALVEALAPLGELARLTLLDPPTWPALQAELTSAQQAGTPYHIVHFDGHGVYQRGASAVAEQRLGLGALVFEDPADERKSERRRSQLINAEQLGQTLREHRVPLVFLEACQSAQAETDPTASVAARLLLGGVASVVAMSHSVLVDSARRFGEVFYRQLLTGARVGQAMLAAQQALYADPCRGKSFDGDLQLQDWFVPVLFQEENDPQLVRATPAQAVQAQIAKAQQLALGKLPPAPPHRFVGRSRELLAAERMLCRHDKDAPRTLVIRGEGGEGKTTVAAELARWLVATKRFSRAAFVSLENSGDARAVLWAIGEQLVPDFVSKAAREPERAEQFVERALGDQPTLLLFDNCESVLPPYGWQAGQADDDTAAASALFDPEILDAILTLTQRMAAVGRTRIIFTSRQPLPQPFAQPERTLGRLDTNEAIELVARVLGEDGHLPASADDPGADHDERIAELVETVGCHARSLVLIAGELRTQRLPQTTETLRQIMADLHRRYPNDRERSLFASVELSLRRLPPELRSKLAPLAVFHGGGHFSVIAQVLGLDTENNQEGRLAEALVDVGLAEILPYGYLRFDPALAPALRGELSDEARVATEVAWGDAMGDFASFLYDEHFQDARVSSALTSFDLENLLAALDFRYRMAASAIPVPTDSSSAVPSFDAVVIMATRLETLLELLGRRRALARTIQIREHAAQRLGAWSHAHVLDALATVNRLQDGERFAEAVDSARRLLYLAQQAGETAYAGAPYDVALCVFQLGRALLRGDHADAGLASLAEAAQRFVCLSEAGNASAKRMISVCVTERANGLWKLGRFDDAAEAFAAIVCAAEERGDRRHVAVGVFELGKVQSSQGLYAEALSTFDAARKAFSEFNEAKMVGNVWHEIGIVHWKLGDYAAAENAYQRSLAIKIQFRDRTGEAMARAELGNLSTTTERFEDAINFNRQAAAIYAEPAIANLAMEGRVRSNAAIALFKLYRYKAARCELHRAIECKKPFGHVAEPWTTFACLALVERADGDAVAARQAHLQATAAYLAYRRDGGESESGRVAARIYASVAEAITSGVGQPLASGLAQMVQAPDVSNNVKPILSALAFILAGSRDPALADVPGLDYNAAAELLLLVEQLTAREA